jgi:hypoxanthine phosphoribosyltransferase
MTQSSHLANQRGAKRVGKQTWRPERVVWVARGGGGVAGGAVAGVALAEWLKVVLPQSVSFNT